MKKLIADIPISPPDGFTGPGTGPIANPGNNPSGTFASVISTSISVITAIAFIYFTFNLFIGGFQVITAGGDKGKVEGARSKITNSLIGLIITISAIFILAVVGSIFGINVINIERLIDQIRVQ